MLELQGATVMVRLWQGARIVRRHAQRLKEGWWITPAIVGGGIGWVFLIKGAIEWTTRN